MDVYIYTTYKYMYFESQFVEALISFFIRWYFLFVIILNLIANISNKKTGALIGTFVNS